MQAIQKGKIGITLVSHWFVPFSRSKSNDDAAKRAIDFMLGWYYISMVLKKFIVIKSIECISQSE
jgi:hypothetical protein